MADAFSKTTQDRSEDNSGNSAPQQEDQPTIQSFSFQDMEDVLSRVTQDHIEEDNSNSSPLDDPQSSEKLMSNSVQDVDDVNPRTTQDLSEDISNNTFPQQRHQSPTEHVSTETNNLSLRHGDDSPMDSEHTDFNNTSPQHGDDSPMHLVNPNSVPLSALEHRVETSHVLIQHGVGTTGSNSFVTESIGSSTSGRHFENHVDLVEPNIETSGCITSDGRMHLDKVIKITTGVTKESHDASDTDEHSSETHSSRAMPSGSDRLVSKPILPVTGTSPSPAGVNIYADRVEASRPLNQLNLTTPGHIPPVTGSNPVQLGFMLCTVCTKPFANQHDFEEHRSWRMQDPSPVQPCTGGMLHKCLKRDNCYTRCDQLARYVQPHTNKGPHLYRTCGKCFTRSHHLMMHMRTHTGEKPYACDVCGKAFSRSSNLISHKVIHTGEKPFACEICDKVFSHSTSLIRHRLIHTGRMPYKCDVCHREFRHSFNLTKHKRTHTGERPYQCPRCPKAFSNRSNLTRHERNQHPEEKP